MMENKEEIKYAGFWVRVLAAFIDGFILAIPITLIEALFGEDSWMSIVFVIVLWWQYTAQMLSSSWRATVGKKVVGLEVLDTNLVQLTFREATFRFLYSFVSYSFILPIFMIFFNDKKQTFHDYFAKTIVIDSVTMSTNKIIKAIRVLGISIVALVSVYLLYMFVMFTFVYGSIYMGQKKSHVNAYKIMHQLPNMDDSVIKFYSEKLIDIEKIFIQNNDVYSLFKSKVQEEILINCAMKRYEELGDEEYFRHARYLADNARNSQIRNSKKEIETVMEHEKMYFEQHNSFDLDLIDSVHEQLAVDMQNYVCSKDTSFEKLYKDFLLIYLSRQHYIEDDIESNSLLKKIVDKEPEVWKDFLKKQVEAKMQEIEDKIYAEKMKKKNEKKKLLEKQNRLWQSAKEGSIYRVGFFKDMNANIRNDKGQTPLMLAVKNGYDMVVSMLGEATVDVWVKDNEGKTAFDYIKQPTNRQEKRLHDSMYGALKILEVEQIIGDRASIPHIGYRTKTGIVNVSIHGASCADFVFPAKTQCESM